MNSNGRKFHAEAAKAREAGNIAESLYRGDDALLDYDKESDDLGFAESLADRSITLRNHASSVDSRRLLILAKHELMAAVEIARESKNPEALPLPLFNYGKTLIDLEETSDVVESLREAVESMEQNPPEMHKRDSVLLDMKIYLAFAEYNAGDESARDRLEDYVNELQNTNDASEYEKAVWVSGGYMKLAEVYKDDSGKSKKYLAKAQEIVNNNPDLTVRSDQIGKLAKRIGH